MPHSNSATTGQRERIARAGAWLPKALAILAALAVAGACTQAGPGPGPPSPHTGGPAAYVRVNQVGYLADGAKRGYLMASGALAGERFEVVTASGAPVYSAEVGARLGSWSARFPDVYALDFDAVTTAGRYRIVVRGPAAAASPPFLVGPGTSLYRPALGNTLSFYRNQRDGPGFIRSALRTAPAHLHDRGAMTYRVPALTAGGGFRGDLAPLGVRVDASGGWLDAGNYLKYVETASYALDLMLITVRDFGVALGPGLSAGFRAEAKFGTDFLRRMWDDPARTLYFQVGIGEGNQAAVGDDDIWRLPQADDTYGGSNPRYRYIRDRPVFPAAAPGGPISPNLAGRTAAAFALCYQVFAASDKAYADSCLMSAEHVFDLAGTNWRGELVTAVPFSSYPETSWHDDLELGATELCDALARARPGSLPSGLPHPSPRYYLTRAARWASDEIAGVDGPAHSLNLYDVSGLAHDELYRAAIRAGDPAGLAVTPARLHSALAAELAAALTQAAADPFGFGVAWGSYDTTSYGAGLSVMANEFRSAGGGAAFGRYAGRWLGNILGANAWGLSFAVGDGTSYPHCLQHQVANLAGTLDGSPPVLAGAAVEGPNSAASSGLVTGMVACPAGGADAYAPFDSRSAQFEDNMQSYANTEPAIDLTATTLLALAWQAAG